jgi:hypothetical protein
MKSLASADHCTKNIGIFPIVVAELKLRNVQRQIFAAYRAIAAHDAALNQHVGRISEAYPPISVYQCGGLRFRLTRPMRCVTLSLTPRLRLCYKMDRISLIEGRQPVTIDWWSGCGSCGRGSSPRLRAVRASSPPAPRPGRGVLRLSAIGGAGNALRPPARAKRGLG